MRPTPARGSGGCTVARPPLLLRLGHSRISFAMLVRDGLAGSDRPAGSAGEPTGLDPGTALVHLTWFAAVLRSKG